MIRKSVKNRKSRLWWQKLNEYFRNEFEIPIKVSNKPNSKPLITKIINCKLDIKVGQFTERELDMILKRKVNIEKLQISTKYTQKYWRHGHMLKYFFGYASLAINKAK